MNGVLEMNLKILFSWVKFERKFHLFTKVITKLLYLDILLLLIQGVSLNESSNIYIKGNIKGKYGSLKDIFYSLVHVKKRL